MKSSPKTRLPLNDYVKGILKGDRFILGRAITVIESDLPADQMLAEKIMAKILPKAGNSIRIGITGVPGVGKSTFIEAFGKYLTGRNKKVAVLAIDPSSQKTKGSILGDKTRMDQLAVDPLAFIRPSATRLTLGGVASKTQETILLCEAAGFEVIIVETVGVGQSEVAVKNMVDFFLLLMLAGAGDELQGIKKGIMEMANGIVITKADGENIKRAKQAQTDFQHALHLFPSAESGWNPKVLTASSPNKTVIKEVEELIQAFQQFTTKNGFFEEQRAHQKLTWFQTEIVSLLHHRFLETAKAKKLMEQFKRKIIQDDASPAKAARELLVKLTAK
ncbi:MAG TPA: methylmalonyl Co-A mutase-associated GTPase MeaB [Cyclobacteriaceae bacterium]|nr:methylmalonyl Co-A mutase-associated GTPase MeaB [Cyclobacteriaceae bacterium]